MVWKIAELCSFVTTFVITKGIALCTWRRWSRGRGRLCTSCGRWCTNWRSEGWRDSQRGGRTGGPCKSKHSATAQKTSKACKSLLQFLLKLKLLHRHLECCIFRFRVLPRVCEGRNAAAVFPENGVRPSQGTPITLGELEWQCIRAVTALPTSFDWWQCLLLLYLFIWWTV